jgi:hypothetical protein
VAVGRVAYNPLGAAEGPMPDDFLEDPKED